MPSRTMAQRSGRSRGIRRSTQKLADTSGGVDSPSAYAIELTQAEVAVLAAIKAPEEDSRRAAATVSARDRSQCCTMAVLPCPPGPTNATTLACAAGEGFVEQGEFGASAEKMAAVARCSDESRGIS